MMTDLLFEASYHGSPVAVGRATDDEIAALAGTVGRGSDVLERWSLVAIRDPARGPEVHALGWRMLLGNTWITSPVIVVDLATGAVRTRSGNAYLLGSRDRADLDPELLEHLAYALRTWGYDDVR
jgi:hypothetical protein